MRRYIIVLVLAGASVAQITQSTFEQVRLSKAATPGSLLMVGADGVSVSPVSQDSLGLHEWVVAMPSAPGCTPIAGSIGKYQVPQNAVAIAVYRNGYRASKPGEFTITSGVLTLAKPIPAEDVLCDVMIP
jgi:hypothetical protein